VKNCDHSAEHLRMINQEHYSEGSRLASRLIIDKIAFMSIAQDGCNVSFCIMNVPYNADEVWQAFTSCRRFKKIQIEAV
jgi:hypothetical protein